MSVGLSLLSFALFAPSSLFLLTYVKVLALTPNLLGGDGSVFSFGIRFFKVQSKKVLIAPEIHV